MGAAEPDPLVRRPCPGSGCQGTCLRPNARGGASRVPFKRPHHPPLTSGCLSAPARVPRRSAPPRPQPRRRHDERAARLGPPVPLCCRCLLAPAVARLRASSRTMSVAGLKKQFHKATQVRRVTGAARGGPGRSCEGLALRACSCPGAWGPLPAPSPPRPRPAAPAPPASASPRWKPAHRFPTPGSVRLGGRPRVPGVPPRLPARRLRTSQRSRYREETRACRCRGGAAGDYVKSPLSPVTLRCRCAGLSRDVLARAVARTGGGCGDVRGLGFSL